MPKKLSLIVALVLLGGCSSSPLQIIDTKYSAKIRVFHGTAVYMFPGQTCYGVKNQETIYAAAGGFSMLVANKKVGMPATGDIPWSYHEYVIPADKPLTFIATGATPDDEREFGVEGGGKRSRNFLAARPRNLT